MNILRRRLCHQEIEKGWSRCVSRSQNQCCAVLTLRGQLKSTKQLLGRACERFLLLGMLAHNKEGKVCLEDSDGRVELDFSKLVSPVRINDINPCSDVPGRT